MKLPSMQFYPGDWRKDPAVQALTFHDRGVWFEILMLMFESAERGRLMLKEGVPMPEAALARLLGLDRKKLSATLETLLEFGVCQRDVATGAIYSRRMVKDEAFRQVRRDSGKLGGNPNLPRKVEAAVSPHGASPVDAVSDDEMPPETSPDLGTDLKVPPKVGPTPSSSLSSSTSSSTSVEEETSSPFAPAGTSSPPGQAATASGDSVRWTASGGFSGITEQDRSRWREAYPAVNLDRAIAAASEWLLRNPARKKRHHARFLSAWLARDQERGGDLRIPSGKPWNPQGASATGSNENQTPRPKLPWE